MNLKLFQGRSWDKLTDAEFDIVARALARAGQSPSYTLTEVCLNILLEVNDLEVLYGNAQMSEQEGGGLEQVYWLRSRNEKKAEPFALPLYMLHYWCKPKKEDGAGMFDWLINGSRRTKPPHVPKLGKRGISRFFPSPFSLFTQSLRSPRRFMSDWTWLQYRAATDYYEQYVRVANAVYRARIAAASPSGKPSNPPNPLVGKHGDILLRDARSQWLATIFTRRVWYRDHDTGIVRFGHHYTEGQATRMAHRFDHISDVDFQKILLWWEGMQHHLQHCYPKCFKRGGGGQKSDPQDPLSIYSRSIATLEKYSGSDEAAINRKTYTVVLQQLNDMVLEHEEYERMRRK